MTAPIEKLIGRVPIALGTDSTLTGSLSLLNEMRVAAKTKNLDPRQVLNLVTTAPAQMLKINKGEIGIGASADFIMFQSNSQDHMNSLLQLSPSNINSVWRGGTPLYGDAELVALARVNHHSISRIGLGERTVFVVGDFELLKNRIRHSAPNLILPKILPA